MSFHKTSFFILLASVSLLGLLLTQGYWFKRAFSHEEKAFDERVHRTLRAVADQMLQPQGDSKTIARPVCQVAFNQYRMALPRPVGYVQLNALLQKELARLQVPQSYELALSRVVESVSAGLEENPQRNRSSLRRTIHPTMYEASLTFPSKTLHVARCLHIGNFSLFALLLVGITLTYGAKLLQKERQLAVLKRDFINNMTHELKTPLSNITLASEVLQNPASTRSGAKALHYASLIHQEAKRLEAQVSRVLEISQLEKGQLQLQLAPVDVHELLKEISQVATFPVEQKGGTLTCELLAERPTVQADRHHLRNLLHNLLENAEKYSPENPIITVTTRNVGHLLAIAVKDRGKGMGAEKDLVFEPFFRAPSGNQHDTKGFGLGLSYVRKVAEAHHARIRLTSRTNQGSTFEVFFVVSDFQLPYANQTPRTHSAGRR